MKKFIAVFAFVFMFVGVTQAQTSDSHNLTVNTANFVELEVNNDLTFGYQYDGITGNSTLTGVNSNSSVTESAGGVTITSSGDATLSWNTNLSNQKITVHHGTYGGDFELDAIRVGVTNINQNAFTVPLGSAGSSAGQVTVTSSPVDVVTGISQGGATADLDYALDFVIYDQGSSSVDVTYTITSQ